MTPRDEAGYRIALAEMQLGAAEHLLQSARFAQAMLFARAAIENAAKAVLACFSAVPRTHEPTDLVSAALAEPSFPSSLRARAQALLPGLVGYGTARHLQLSYGDEKNLLTPDQVVGESESRQAAVDARLALDLALDVRRAVIGP